jgi:hypothetical protein
MIVHAFLNGRNLTSKNYWSDRISSN